MPRRKPVEAKILEGTFRSDKDGDPALVVLAQGQPVPPVELAGRALEFWERVVPGLVALGVVGESDSATLGLMCQWWARHERAGKALDRAKVGKESYGLLVQAGIAFDKFDRIASRFGMTPVDRAKLKLQPARDGAQSVPQRDREQRRSQG